MALKRLQEVSDFWVWEYIRTKNRVSFYHQSFTKGRPVFVIRNLLIIAIPDNTDPQDEKTLTYPSAGRTDGMFTPRFRTDGDGYANLCSNGRADDKAHASAWFRQKSIDPGPGANPSS
ncbi:MAG: hypothetical protein A2Z03_07030 [Chloroflexi bacterium RBG_16_56_8]|nr:MAG: hypothetical protein A2Z03_07030 [Chloroflexi bacterium RBG_16_56_8]